MIIYKITNIINKKVYVGQTTWPFNHRRSIHFSKLRRNEHQNKHLQSSFNKHGKQNFIFEIIEKDIQTHEELNEKEMFWIKELNSCDPVRGYNIEIGGSKKRRDGYVVWNKGLPKEKQPRFGKKLDPMIIQERLAAKVPKQKKQKVYTKKIAWNKGIKTSLIPWNKGLPKEKQSMYGKKHSEETRKRQSESAKKRIYSEAQLERAKQNGKTQSRPIYCLTNKKTYESISHASKELGLRRASINLFFSGKRKHVQGFLFKALGD